MSVIASRFPLTPFMRALRDWRQAECLVSTRWETFRAAEPETRGFAFTSYVEALDAEEAAAARVARFSLSAAPRGADK